METRKSPKGTRQHTVRVDGDIDEQQAAQETAWCIETVQIERFTDWLDEMRVNGRCTKTGAVALDGVICYWGAATEG